MRAGLCFESLETLYADRRVGTPLNPYKIGTSHTGRGVPPRPHRD